MTITIELDDAAAELLRRYTEELNAFERGIARAEGRPPDPGSAELWARVLLVNALEDWRMLVSTVRHAAAA